MQSVNIFHVTNYTRAVQDESLSNKYTYHLSQSKDLSTHPMKEHEFSTLESLVNILKHRGDLSINDFDHFYLSFCIPTIKKEFDLLRFGTDTIVNIELKSQGDEDRIRKQLKRNEWYLQPLRKKLVLCTYVEDTQTLYTLSNGNLEQRPIDYLANTLQKQKNPKDRNMHHLFKPSNYLIAPTSNPEDFINKRYFLTPIQEEALNTLQKNIHKMNRFYKIQGGPGMGKTLFMFHFMRELNKQPGKKILFIHCGLLNQGHISINNRFKKIKIIPVKEIESQNINIYDYIFVDEAQRIYQSQFEELVRDVKKYNKKCVFSVDSSQILSQKEEEADIEGKIDNLIDDKECRISLNSRIRYNDKLNEFINAIFNERKCWTNNEYIDLLYALDTTQAKEIIKAYQMKNYKFINYTPSLFNQDYADHFDGIHYTNAHQAIGQGFNKVVTYMHEIFGYQDYQLVQDYVGNPYRHDKMLYQALTRAGERLCVVVIDNIALFENILKRMDESL